MPAISDEEHEKFLHLHELGHKMLTRGRELVEKDELTKEEARELAEIRDVLQQVDEWFTKTAK